LEPFAVTDGRRERIVLKGENIRFPPPAALALGIVFNELATNAAKYGALSNEAGSIQIEWTKKSTSEGAQILLHWTEKDGPPVTTPSRKGYGTRVIERGLAHELASTMHLDFEPDGLACTMTIPIPRVARRG
jgi:two-component sensor histidine kinase